MNGAVYSGSNLILQTADATNPGLVSTTAQTFAGNKTFLNNVTINGSQTITTSTIANLATGGTIGTAVATVDVFTTFNVNQTTADQTITLPTPTVTIAGKMVYVNNIGSVEFIMVGSRVRGNTGRSFIWNGTAWSLVGDSNDQSQIIVRKTADQTNATATLANDTQLTMNIGANEQWVIQYNLSSNAQANADFKFAVTAPAGATCSVSAYDPEGATAQANIGCGVASGLIAASGLDDPIWVSAVVTNGATAGTVNLQWSEFTVNGVATIRQ